MISKNENGITVIQASDGKTFANLNGDIIGSCLWLGCEDSKDNYIEFDTEKLKSLETQAEAISLQIKDLESEE